MLRNLQACLIVVALVAIAPSLAFGQDAPPAEANPEATETPAEKATRLFKEGAAHEEAKEFDEAIAKYEEALATVEDFALYVRIGQANQLKGNTGPDFEAYKKAIKAYETYLEKAPEGPEDIAKVVNERITTLETALSDEEKRLKEKEESEKQQKIDEAREKREDEERDRKKKAKLDGMRLAIDGMIVAGLDQDMSIAARFIAGGMAGWKYFGLEAHLAFENFFPLSDEVGTSGRSLTILDLGFRVGKGAKNYQGIFASAGGGFGLFGGNPRERRLKDDPEVCAGFGDPNTPNSCKFDIDKNITGRFGLGYGFAASKLTTVAARLDFTYWLLSVDGEQSQENVPATLVSKPQQGFSVLVGLEFMRWF